MSMDRREFLKIAGAGTILGLAGLGLFERVTEKDIEAVVERYIKDPSAMNAKRWAMVVDLRRFKTEEDYQRIIKACHKIHNVPDFGNPKDEIKWIWVDTYGHAFPGQEHDFLPEWLESKFIPLLCNHCANPPCVRVCPVKATFKSPDGITQQDYHRCIGCRFCMAACPFGARSFNWRDPRPFIKEVNQEFPTRTKGVVEKCNFCTERLAKGLKPACVEESKGALIFGDLLDPDSEVRQVLRKEFTVRRKAELGTDPSVFYIIGGSENV
jgi:Fe-S-cluster-containing dehydrogenase component